MCTVHTYKFVCGCWRDPTAKTSHCKLAVTRNPATGQFNGLCPLEKRKAMIRPSVWKCIDHCPVKQFRGDFAELYQNLDRVAVEKVMRTGSYEGIAETPLQTPVQTPVQSSFPIPVRSSSASQISTASGVSAQGEGPSLVQQRFYGSFYNNGAVDPSKGQGGNC